MKSIFISYCHEPIYGDLIQAFVDKLLKLGIPAVNDKYDLSPGNDLDVFMSDIVDREKCVTAFSAEINIKIHRNAVNHWFIAFFYFNHYQKKPLNSR